MSKQRSSMTEGPLAQLFAATMDGSAASDAPASNGATATPAPAPATGEPEVKRTRITSKEPRKSVSDSVPKAMSPGQAASGKKVSPVAADASTYLAVIRVIGVGGAGINAIERMMDADVRGVEFIAVNTDLQQLEMSNAPVRLHIGADLTRGLGAGADPAIGKEAAESSYDHLRHILKGSDMVFVTCGEGGGTGTGAAPVVCKAARELGALTVAIVTTPFAFEGSNRTRAADSGLAALREHADTVITIPNNRLLEVLHRGTSMVEAFRVADDVLRQGVQGISDLITMPGLINVDFADVRTIMTEAGSALMGIGFGSGEDRAVEAARSAINSPLIAQSPRGASRILLSISGGDDLSLHEVTEAAKVIQQAASDDANIIFGATVDSRLTGQVWVTVVATGFGETRSARFTSPSSSARSNGIISAGGAIEDDLDLPDFLK